MGIYSPAPAFLFALDSPLQKFSSASKCLSDPKPPSSAPRPLFRTCQTPPISPLSIPNNLNAKMMEQQLELFDAQRLQHSGPALWQAIIELVADEFPPPASRLELTDFDLVEDELEGPLTMVIRFRSSFRGLPTNMSPQDPLYQRFLRLLDRIRNFLRNYIIFHDVSVMLMIACETIEPQGTVSALFPRGHLESGLLIGTQPWVDLIMSDPTDVSENSIGDSQLFLAPRTLYQIALTEALEAQLEGLTL